MLDLDLIADIGAVPWAWRTLERQFCKRVLQIDNTMRLPTGLSIRLPKSNHFSSEVFISQCRVDWGSELIFSNALDPKGVMLDVGAHIGYYSLYVLPLVAEVHAFEPDPRIHKDLLTNLEGHANAHFHNAAVGNAVGRIRLALGTSPELSHVEDPRESYREAVEVDLISIDHFTATRQLFVTGVKVDAEGADFEILQGAIHTLRQHSPLVLTEAKPDAGLFDLISPLNYRVFAFTRQQVASQCAFAELVRSATPACRTKMVFLVPARLHAHFEAIGANTKH